MQKNLIWQRVGVWLTWTTIAAAVVLVILKLSNVIAWPWWAVLAPAYIPFGLVLILVVGVIVIGINTKPKYNEEDDSRGA